MSARLLDNLMGAALLTVFLVLLGVALGYGGRARLVPVPVAGIAAVLLLIDLVISNLGPRQSLSTDIMGLRGRAGRVMAQSGFVERSGREGGKEWVAFALVALYLLFAGIAGMMWGTGLYVFGYLVWVSKWRPGTAALYSGMLMLVVYLVFARVLGIQMYSGLLGNWSL